MSTRPSWHERAVTEAFVELADTLVADFDVLELLNRLAAHCVDLLDVTAAGLLMTDEYGRLRLLASSNEQSRLVELFQLQRDEQGPCLDCMRSGEAVTATDLALYADRWPGFVEQAQRMEFHTVHALPMRLRDETIGALNLFRSQPTPLTTEDLVLAQALADVATIGILQQRALGRRELLVEQLQGALNSRVIIEQAKGVLADRGDMDVDQAFVLLRHYARTYHDRLSDLAHRVVNDRMEAQRVLGSARPSRAEGRTP